MSESASTLQKVRVYYLSSGKLGTHILDALLQNDAIELVGIGSQPDRLAGRKHELKPTEFTRHALAKGCEVDRIKSVNTPEFLDKLRSLGTEILLVVAFGQLLKSDLLSLPTYGCVNVHASLLPKYRGACPIAAAILNGDEKTGVTFMRMDAGLDTGPVYETVFLDISATETAEQLEERLGKLASEHIGGVLWKIAREGMEPTPQPPATAPNVHKIAKTDGAISWTRSAKQIYNMIRAYQPWPGSYTSVQTKGQWRRIQITKATYSAAPTDKEPGQIISTDGKTLAVACGSGTLFIHSLFPEGKKEMTVESFLSGNPVLPGSMME